MASQQALMMQQLLQRQQQSQGKMVEFKCGKMNKNDGETTVTPDPRKGKLTVKMDREDQLMHFIWTNREQGIQEDDMIIFPGEATFGYVEQARNNKTNNRVYALKFTSTPKKVHFFWMQEPASAAEKDKELAEKVNALINGESAGAAYGGTGQMDQEQLMAMLTQAHSSPGSASESPAAPAAGQTETTTTTGEAAGAGAEAGAAPAEGGSTEATENKDGIKDDADEMKVDDEAKP